MASLYSSVQAQIEQSYASQPWSEEKMSLKWDGEWQITYETFRDMGIAFAVAMLLIYLLIEIIFQIISLFVLVG